MSHDRLRGTTRRSEVYRNSSGLRCFVGGGRIFTRCFFLSTWWNIINFHRLGFLTEEGDKKIVSHSEIYLLKKEMAQNILCLPVKMSPSKRQYTTYFRSATRYRCSDKQRVACRTGLLCSTMCRHLSPHKKHRNCKSSSSREMTINVGIQTLKSFQKSKIIQSFIK